MPKPQIVPTNGADHDFAALCHELDDYLDVIADGRANRAQYLPYNNADGVEDVFVAYLDGKPAGCAALKLYDAGAGEIKRVFVKTEYRGRGVSLFLMQALEDRAKTLGLTALILETGDPLKAAMGLYQKLGYVITVCYGPYKNMPDSVCMRKEL